MFLTLIRRELLDNLMTFRFAAAVVIMLLLVVANTVVLIRDYEQRLVDYNAAVKTHRQDLRQESKTYSYAMLGSWVMHIDRPPNPLSIFNTGLDKRLGNNIRISHIFTPTIWDAKKYAADNPLFNILTSIDIVLIFQGILSLLALIFAYDAIAGGIRTRHPPLGTIPSRGTWGHPVRQIYRCDGLLARAVGDESAPDAHFADDFHYDFPEHR